MSFCNSKFVFFSIIILLMSCALVSCGRVQTFWLNNAASKAMDKGDFKDAIEKYKRLIEINPNNSNHYWNLGIAYVQDGDINNAKRQLEKLKKLGEKDFSGELSSYIHQHSEGYTNTQIGKLKQSIQRDPDNYRNYWNLAVMYIRQNNFSAAKKQVEVLRRLKRDELAAELLEEIKKKEGR